MKYFLLLLLAFLSSQSLCKAQSPGEVETLIRKSKLVDTNRPVRVVTGAKQMAISTYVDKKATDRDCQITALLMMKEIVGKYPKIASAKVNFFDPATASTYKSVLIERKHVDSLDKGIPVQSVLSTISVAKGKASFQTASVQGKSSAATAGSVKTTRGGSPGGYTRFYSKDGSFSICYPSHWTVLARLKDDQVFSCSGEDQDLVVSLEPNESAAECFDHTDQYYSKVYNGYSKISQNPVSMSGKEGFAAVRTYFDQGNLNYMHKVVFHEHSSALPVYTIELFVPGSMSVEEGRQHLMTILSTFQFH